MNTIVIAIISTAAIGFLCAAVITIASKLMFVKVDVRVEKVRNSLPGANCGACGFSGCDLYADALIRGDAAVNLCPPGGNETIDKISEILGIGAGEGLADLKAVVHCLGDTTTLQTKMEYIGIKTCFAAKHLFCGPGSCTYGCIGFGDCVSVCPSDAICMVDGLARIDPRKCSGCKVCEKMCPSKVISMHSAPVNIAVMCKNTERGAKLKGKCTRGCIGCMKCVKACAVGAITVNESLASIDYSLCNGCRECVDVCIASCIV